MTANVITYRGRSAAREVGKALGFEPAQIDRLAKVMNNFEFIDPADTLPRQLGGGRPRSERGARPAVRAAVARDAGSAAPSRPALRRHGDLPGTARRGVPLENASMPGRVVVQWDKDDCADMGIVKVDLLGLGMMAVLQDALALVNGEHDDQGRSRRARRDSHRLCGLRELLTCQPRVARSRPSAAGRPGRLPDAAARPTRSASSRSSRARRWRRCRA